MAFAASFLALLSLSAAASGSALLSSLGCNLGAVLVGQQVLQRGTELAVDKLAAKRAASAFAASALGGGNALFKLIQ